MPCLRRTELRATPRPTLHESDESGAGECAAGGVMDVANAGFGCIMLMAGACQLMLC